MHLKNGVHATTKFLEMFFDNLLMGMKHELKNRYMHVDYVEETDENEFQSANSDIQKCQNGTLKLTIDEMAILSRIVKNPVMTQNELAEQTGKSLRTVKREMDKLKEKGYIKRVNGKRNGQWDVLIDISNE